MKTSNLAAILLAFLFLVAQTANAQSGLIAHWAANGNAQDSVGSNHGTLSGVTFAPGISGQAFDFGGDGDFVNFGNAIGNFSTNDFAISLWIKTTSTRYSEAIMQRRPLCNGVSGWDIRRGPRSLGTMHCALFQSTSGENFNSPGTLQVINDGQWHHFVIARQQTNMTIYLDGSFQTNSATPGITIIDNSVNMTCGSDPCIGIDGTSPFTGQLDEIKIYNRAISPDEVTSMYNEMFSGPPRFTVHPADVTITEGWSVTLKTAALGQAPMSYQWRFNGENIAGATSAQLSISPVALQNAGTYSVIASNSVGTAVSSNCVLTVQPVVPPSITPIALWHAEGDAQDSAGSNHGVISGVTFVPGVSGQAFAFGGDGDFIDFGNRIGNFGTNDFSISLWVKTTSSRYSEAIMQKRPRCDGTSGWDIRRGAHYMGVMECSVFQSTSGSNFNSPTTVRYINDGQWHHFVATRLQTNVTIYLDGMFITNSATAGITMVSNAVNLTCGSDPCIGVDGTVPFTGELDEISIYNRAISVLEVQSLYNENTSGAPRFTLNPANVTTNEGRTVTLAAVAAGQLPIFYQWRFNGNDISGATDSQFSITSVALENAGTYSVFASNSVGTAVSSDCVLTVNPVTPPSVAPIAWWRAEGNAQDSAGSNHGTLSGVTFVPGIFGQAFDFGGDGGFVNFGSSIGNFGTDDFTISLWIKTTSTRYSEAIMQRRPVCDGTSGWDIRRGPRSLGTMHCSLFQSTSGENFNSPATSRVINDGQWHHFVAARQQTNLTIYLDGVFQTNSATAGVTVVDNAVDLTCGSDPCIGVDGTFPFTGQLDEIRIYNRAISFQEVESLYNEAFSGPPQFVVQPADIATLEGGKATFNALATGQYPMSYQWRFKGKAIAGATGREFSISPVRFQDAGEYSVIASNSVGVTESSTATLTVEAVVPPSTSPIAWWRAEGDAQDSAGQNHGTLSGVTFVAGKCGQAFNFDGDGAFVDFGNTIGNFGTNDFTISLWIKTSSGAYSEAVMQKRPICDGTSGWDIRRGPRCLGTMHCALFQSTSGENFNSPGTLRVVNDGQWHHFVAARRQTNITIYLDGTFQTNSATPGITVVDNFAHMTCGSDPCIGVDGTTPFTGQLDEIQIYNRALGAGEVQSLYNGGNQDSRAPVIVLEPRDQRRNQGESPTFIVVAVGSHPLAYQWRLGGKPIADATDSALAISNLSETNGFSVVVSNPYGSVTSRTAYILQTIANGNYNALFYETNEVKHESSGLLSLNVGTKGTFTGSIMIEGAKKAFSGKLTNQEANIVVTRTNKPNLNVHVALACQDRQDIVTGQVTDGTWTAPLEGGRSVYSKARPAQQAGLYTMVMEQGGSHCGPRGNGFGTLTVSPTGAAMFSGNFADTALGSRSVPLSARGDLPLYVPLYAGKGSLLSWISFSNQPNASFTGHASWIKKNAYGKYFTNGFTNDALIVGSTYLRPTNRAPINVTNAVVLLSGDALSVSTNVTLSQTKATAPGATNIQILTINPKTGLFSGNVMDTSRRVKIPVKGALLQQQTNGAGYFINTNLNGEVEVAPR